MRSRSRSPPYRGGGGGDRRHRSRSPRDRDRRSRRSRSRDRRRRSRDRDRSRNRDRSRDRDRRRYHRSEPEVIDVIDLDPDDSVQVASSRDPIRINSFRRRDESSGAGSGGPESSSAEKSAEQLEMEKLMGFCAFDTTKGKFKEWNNAGAVDIVTKRKYRQYMNRKGGFNRPLDFVA